MFSNLQQSCVSFVYVHTEKFIHLGTEPVHFLRFRMITNEAAMLSALGVQRKRGKLLLYTNISFGFFPLEGKIFFLFCIFYGMKAKTKPSHFIVKTGKSSLP